MDDDNFIFVEQSADLKTDSVVLDWMESLSHNLLRGFVVIVDYGFSRDEFREVVQVRQKHRQLDSPFEQIGEADITTHLNWSEIAQ